jgi:hypothetical protein
LENSRLKVNCNFFIKGFVKFLMEIKFSSI